MLKWLLGKHNQEEQGRAKERSNLPGGNRASNRVLFERLVETHANDFYGTALRMTRNRDDANDLVQDTLLRAYAAFDTFAPGTNFRAWVLRILTNNYVTLYRRRQIIKFVRWDSMAEPEDRRFADVSNTGNEQPEKALLCKTMHADIEEALTGLSEGVRLVVLLVEVEELSYEETAVALGIPVGTVRSRLNRGREQMRHSLTSYAKEYGLTARVKESNSHGPL